MPYEFYLEPEDEKRHPSSLYSESGKLVPPEDLLDDEEEIPLIG